MKKKQKNNKKITLFVLVFLIIVFLISFFIIKSVNAYFNGKNGLDINFLTTFNEISLFLPKNQDIPNIIDYVANVILLIVLPVFVFVFILLFFIFIINNSVHNVKKNKINDDSKHIDDNYEKYKVFLNELKNESSNDTALLEQRSKNDGSIHIKEDYNELLNNAYKIKDYAILNNIEVNNFVLEEMTKKELILFMKKIIDHIQQTKKSSI